MRSGKGDTAPQVLDILADGYRRMSSAAKLARVFAMNDAVRALAASRIRDRYGPEVPERELRLRLAALWLDRETMQRAFHWDPEEKGY